MTDTSDDLLNHLKDNDHCNEELAQRVKQTILEPFKVDPSRSESLKQPPRAVFKHLVNQMAPLSMKIVNQNINQLENLKKKQASIKNRIVVLNCLVDSSFYALAALRHMNATKHLEIEKTTSNLLCKMVDLGEYTHALEELVKFQDILASLTKVRLKRDTKKDNQDRTVRCSSRGFLTESQNIQRDPATPTPSQEPSSKPAPINQWEDDMLNKYEVLFQFPNDEDNKTKDKTIVLLVLAYQMNAIRCLCGIKDRSLSKYIPYLLEQPGSFIDWAKHLCTLDLELGKRQLDSLQRILLKTSNALPSSSKFDEKREEYTLDIFVFLISISLGETPYYVFSLQALSSIIALEKANTIKQPMDRLVRSGMTYEKNSRQVNYNQIQKYCGEALKEAAPDTSNLVELEAYFTLCEFYAYISKKVK
ncbi:hypothetical protein K501DRAFT_169714 [Backusella circina FSU 941]|nr:hypothetical protein K501DRAFT_169714 [Backusella circina FSU 941]